MSDTPLRLPEVTAFTDASNSLNRCKCGSRAVMVYHPGCTYIHCIKESKTVFALPSWCPTELAREWNEGA